MAAAILVATLLLAQALGTWEPAATMAQGRAGHTATLLTNGKVLIAGETSAGQPVASADLPLVVAAENPSLVSTRPTNLEVTYDRTTDLVSIRARHVPLGEILQEIAQHVPLTISSPQAALLTEHISVDIKRLPLAQALRELLARFNSVVLDSPATDAPQKTTTPRLVRVFLLSPATLSSEARVAEEAPRPAVDQRFDRSLGVLGIVETLKKSAGGKEREEAVQALLSAVNHKDSPIRPDAIAALKHFAPERALDAFVDLLRDQKEDRRVRVLAVSGLGEIGDARAFEHLTWAFHESDPIVRQVAANSLAHRGGTREVGFLLQLLRSGDRDLQRIAAIALAFEGNEQAKAAAARVIAQHQVTEDAIPKHVIDKLVGSK